MVFIRRIILFNLMPKLWWMVWLDHMAKFMNNDIVNNWMWCFYEMPIKSQSSFLIARTPSRFIVFDFYFSWRNPNNFWILNDFFFQSFIRLLDIPFFDISFNSKYLIDVASQLEGESIEIYFNDISSPALIKDPSDFDSIFIVMPMKG